MASNCSCSLRSCSSKASIRCKEAADFCTEVFCSGRCNCCNNSSIFWRLSSHCFSCAIRSALGNFKDCTAFSSAFNCSNVCSLNSDSACFWICSDSAFFLWVCLLRSSAERLLICSADRRVISACCAKERTAEAAANCWSCAPKRGF